MSDRSMPSSFDDNREYQETGFAKISRKLREEPLIPLGCVLTSLALYNAWRAMRRGDHAGVQRMFRARIGAQAFTVVAMVAGGAYYGADREKRKELIKLEAQQRAEERHNKWLKELEVRDEEDKALKADLKRKRERVESRKAAAAAAAAEAEKEAQAEEGAKEATAQRGVETQDRKDGDSKSGSVLNALSEAGGSWFGSSKKGDVPPPSSSAEQSTSSNPKASPDTPPKK